jgi:hypothetical protein
VDFGISTFGTGSFDRRQHRRDGGPTTRDPAANKLHPGTTICGVQCHEPLQTGSLLLALGVISAPRAGLTPGETAQRVHRRTDLPQFLHARGIQQRTAPASESGIGDAQLIVMTMAAARPVHRFPVSTVTRIANTPLAKETTVNKIRILLVSIPLLLAACASVQKPDAAAPGQHAAATPSATMECSHRKEMMRSMMTAGAQGKGHTCDCMKTTSAGAPAPTATKPDPGAARPADDEHKAHHPDGKE